jgi:Asp-tRNA(Asn)/Glu-tRNA(Gln) amidotransferase A subunit family amidase
MIHMVNTFKFSHLDGVTMDIDQVRKDADAATEHYQARRPLSLVDGMSFGVKDLYKTADTPRQRNRPIDEGWLGVRDAVHVYAMCQGEALIVRLVLAARPGARRLPPAKAADWSTRTVRGRL